MPLYSTQAELVALHYLKSFNVVRMCNNNIFASTFIGLIGQWHRLHNHNCACKSACSTTCLTNACKEQCVPDKGILTYTLFAASPQQTHSLHLRMLLDPHNRQHLPKLGIRFPYCSFALFHMISNARHRASHLIMWRLDMSGMILAFCSSLLTDIQVPRKFRLNISRKIS